jgi:hypothetical protein
VKHAPDARLRGAAADTLTCDAMEVQTATPTRRLMSAHSLCHAPVLLLGSDRTGELMGAWNLHYNHLTWRETLAVNTAIAQRPMGCRNYLAMQWYCLWQSGQRQQSLGCLHNEACTIFDS